MTPFVVCVASKHSGRSRDNHLPGCAMCVVCAHGPNASPDQLGGQPTVVVGDWRCFRVAKSGWRAEPKDMQLPSHHADNTYSPILQSAVLVLSVQ